FNTLTSYGSPSYYAQVMFAQHLGNEIIPAKLEGGGNRLFYSVTKHSDSGVLEVKIVNAASTPQPLNIDLQNAAAAGAPAKLITLSATKPRDTNTIKEPTKIVPAESTVPLSGNNLQHTFAPYSINIIEIPTR